MHPARKRAIREALEQLKNDPTIGRPLRDELAGLHRIRVGPMRIVYQIGERSIEVIAIGPRASVYLDLLAGLRRSKDDR